MTHETKLGLVVGGAFILCFALILSNTQHEAAVDRQAAALTGKLSSPLGISQQAHRGRLPDRTLAFEQPDRRAIKRTPLPRSLTHNGDRTQELPPSTSPQTVIAPANSAQEPTVATLRQPLPSHQSSPSSTVADAIANRPLHGSRRSDPTPRGQSSPKSSRPADQSTPLRVQVYVVSKHDSLSKIAKKFYGRSSPEAVKRIYEANSSRLKDVNSIVIGQRLNIPLPTARTESQRTSRTILAMAESGGSAAEKSWRWYQVKENDRYSRIARKLLGNADRWPEIHELNKSTFPDPNRIRPGVRIKVPLAE